MSIRKGKQILAGSGGAGNPDNRTIKLTNNKLQAFALTNANSGTVNIWTGTLAEYNALEEYSDTTIYNITDDIASTVVVDGVTIKNIDNTLTIPTASTQSAGIVKPDGLTIKIKDGVISSSASGLTLFDTILKDHILSYEESKGLALQGTYVYKNASFDRYGYPEFYEKCLQEYKNSVPQYVQNNMKVVGTLTDNNGVISGFGKDNYLQGPSIDGSFNWEIVIKLHTPQQITQNYSDFFGIDNAVAICVNPESQCFRISMNDQNAQGNGWQTLIDGSHTVQLDTDYYIKIYYDGQYYLDYSFDGINYTNDITINTDYKCYGISNFGKYKTEATINQFEGSIDLKETHINNYLCAVNLYKHNNGHIFYSIQNLDYVDNVYEQTGKAWYYGIDEINERIFLPRNDWFEQLTGNSSEVGQSVEAGLPNITGSLQYLGAQLADATGAYYSGENLGSGYGAGSSPRFRQYFDASRCSSIYGNSNTVQPSSIKKLLYICVGNIEVKDATAHYQQVTTSENDTLPLFTPHYFDFKPNVSWIKAGTYDGKIYKIYNTLVNELTNPVHNLKVIDAKDVVGDCSTYWVVDQTNQTFTTPLRLDNRTLIKSKQATTQDLSWYNLYSDGYLEQGGYYTGTTDAWITQPFLHSYSVKPIVNIQRYSDSTNDDSATTDRRHYMARGITLTGFNAWGVWAGYKFLWEAKGYTTVQNANNLYFKVANAVENIQLLDAQAVLGTIQDKISRNDCAAYIVKTYKNGYNWYRLWSDGWIEQGGKYQGSFSTLYNVPITLLIPFSDTYYNISTSSSDLNNDKYGEHGENIEDVTTTSFTYYYYTGSSVDGTAGFYWRACGY